MKPAWATHGIRPDFQRPYTDKAKPTNKLCVVANVCNPSTWETRQKDPEFSLPGLLETLFTNKQISRDLGILGEGIEISQGCFYPLNQF